VIGRKANRLAIVAAVIGALLVGYGAYDRLANMEDVDAPNYSRKAAVMNNDDVAQLARWTAELAMEDLKPRSE